MTKASETAKRLMRSVKDKVMRTKQGQYTVAGTGIGAAAGLIGMGSIGVATGIGAFALPGIVLLAVPGLIIGNRIGVELEKRDLEKKLRADTKREEPEAGPIIDL